MKLFKWCGVAAFAGMAMLALVASPSASAANTVLCKVEESPCPLANRWEEGLFEARAEPFKVLTLVNVECTNSKLTGALGASGSPQAVGIESLTFAGCKTAGGTACTVVAVGLGGLDLLRTNVNLGEGTLLNTAVKSRVWRLHQLHL